MKYICFSLLKSVLTNVYFVASVGDLKPNTEFICFYFCCHNSKKEETTWALLFLNWESNKIQNQDFGFEPLASTMKETLILRQNPEKFLGLQVTYIYRKCPIFFTVFFNLYVLSVLSLFVIFF